MNVPELHDIIQNHYISKAFETENVTTLPDMVKFVNDWYPKNSDKTLIDRFNKEPTKYIHAALAEVIDNYREQKCIECGRSY